MVTFTQLRQEWEGETKFLSSTSDICAHPAYRKIIEMGDEALPDIFRAMREKPGHWFQALTEITGENPIPDDIRGDMQAMTDAWISLAHYVLHAAAERARARAMRFSYQAKMRAERCEYVFDVAVLEKSDEYVTTEEGLAYRAKTLSDLKRKMGFNQDEGVLFRLADYYEVADEYGLTQFVPEEDFEP